MKTDSTNKPGFLSSIWWKVTLIVLISLLLMIPVSLVESLIRERHWYSDQAKNEVAQKWSRGQTLGAVVLTVPIVQERTRKDKDGKMETVSHNTFLHFLPDAIKIDADTQSVIRHRGLYRIPLYETRLELTGTFSKLTQAISQFKNTQVLWNRAELNMGIDELRGLKEVGVEWNGKKKDVSVGDMVSRFCSSALKVMVPIKPEAIKNSALPFKFSLQLKGSETLDVLPFGETTVVNMKSNWGDPSFYGAFLPDQYDIQPDAFQAQWKVLGLNRNLPKHWVGGSLGKEKLNQSRFGVKFLLPLETYQLNTRSVKYSFLFVALTFLTLFFIEILFGLKFHPMHYVMTGAGLCLFYLLLLSLSEHLGFSTAYGLAGGATLLSIALYIFGVTRAKKGAGIVFAQLTALYGFLFILLKQEDYALVVGASGLWIALVVLMYVTRRIDWFNIDVHKTRAEWVS